MAEFKTGLAGENANGECWIYDNWCRPALIVLAKNSTESDNELQQRADKITEVLNKCLEQPK